MKKIISMMALAAMTACALVSCSDDNDGPGKPKSETITIEQNGQKVSFKMIPVKAGTFTMGATPEQWLPDEDEFPAHSVTLTKDYYLGETEVTQELWTAVMGSNPSYFEGENLPVEQVTWLDCQAFIIKLNQLTGKQFRLPTEAEWEFAARGGKKSKGYQFSGSDTADEVAWNKNNSDGKTHPVKTKKANELGFYDMSGNVSEWCQDWWDEKYYSVSPSIDPTGPSTGHYRVFRASDWDRYRSRVADRSATTEDHTFYYLGFRLAL